MAETTRARAARIASELHRCAWCGEDKPKSEMRFPGVDRGKIPATCQPCREAHPDEAWCAEHGTSHRRGQFKATSTDPTRVENRCRAYYLRVQSERRGHPERSCPSCNTTKASWFFRGGGGKAPTCRACETEHVDQRWCQACAMWLSVVEFDRWTAGGIDYTATRCKPCRAAYSHRTTVAALLDLQGSTTPECAACGSTSALHIDHDHVCCPGINSCGACVRGYLCSSCNLAEGLLVTPERARALLAYMERHAVST